MHSFPWTNTVSSNGGLKDGDTGFCTIIISNDSPSIYMMSTYIYIYIYIYIYCWSAIINYMSDIIVARWAREETQPWSALIVS